MSAPLKRRVALLEAKLAAETEAHKQTFDVYRDVMFELVEIKLRHKAADAALNGKDYFGGQV